MNDYSKIFNDFDFREMEYHIVAQMIQKYGAKEDLSQQETFTEEYERDLDF